MAKQTKTRGAYAFLPKAKCIPRVSVRFFFLSLSLWCLGLLQNGLRLLSQTVLGREIQGGDSGHDSCEVIYSSSISSSSSGIIRILVPGTSYVAGS